MRKNIEKLSVAKSCDFILSLAIFGFFNSAIITMIIKEVKILAFI